jgi:hypothetical protein
VVEAVEVNMVAAVEQVVCVLQLQILVVVVA